MATRISSFLSPLLSRAVECGKEGRTGGAEAKQILLPPYVWPRGRKKGEPRPNARVPPEPRSGGAISPSPCNRGSGPGGIAHDEAAGTGQGSRRADMDRGSTSVHRAPRLIVPSSESHAPRCDRRATDDRALLGCFSIRARSIVSPTPPLSRLHARATHTCLGLLYSKRYNSMFYSI
jgi:hypothetical protein